MTTTPALLLLESELAMYERANDIDRDYVEEAYWRAFCPECGESPCQSDNNHADLRETGYDVINHTDYPVPETAS